jgi:hypothetical protein
MCCITIWQKAFDHVKWTKLMQIPKETGIKWSERKMIRKFYMDHKVKSMTGPREKYDWTKGIQEV